MAATSFKGPVAGAYIPLVVVVPANATQNTSTTVSVKLPAGMTARLQAANAAAKTQASTPTISVGSVATPTKYVNAANVSTVPADLTLVSTAGHVIDAGDNIAVKVTNGASTSHTGVEAVLWMYVTAHMTNVPADGGL